MCYRCKEIDAKIAQYQRLARGVSDQQANDAAKHLIADLVDQKAILHLEPQD
jgi:hypothetical protein